MGIKARLTILNFLQFFVWGTWLISFGGYLMVTLGYSGTRAGSIFATMGLASLFMPAIAGLIADRWVSAEKLFGTLHLTGAGILLASSYTTGPYALYVLILLYSMCYMPTIALNYSLSYFVLEKNACNVVRDFPPIRVWGTVGFIIAVWTTDLCGWTLSNVQLIFASAASAVLGIYGFTLPSDPPARLRKGNSFLSVFGLDALVLFRRRKMITFFIFAIFLGAALQIANTFGQPFLHDFAKRFPDSFAVIHPGILLSVSQISETLFILAIPFFMSRLGIKRVILMSIVAWILRFGLFAIGNPGSGMIFLVISMIVYGMAFDFFNISGSMFVENEAGENIRSGAQGVFMMMSNGVGASVGGMLSGWVVDYFTHDGVKNWTYIWVTFAIYMLVLGIMFQIAFIDKTVNRKP